MTDNSTALDDAIGRLQGIEPEASLDNALQQVVDAISAVLRVDGCGLMFVDEGGVLRYFVASDAAARELEVAEETLGFGPCVDAFVNDERTTTSDLLADERWPELGQAVAAAGIRAVAGLPVRVGGGRVGALDAYFSEAHDWSDDELGALGAFNTIVESLVASAVMARRQGELVGQLQHALDQRVTIERAIGLVMGTERIDALSAFNQIRARARAERRKVADIAAELLNADGTAPPA